MRLEDYWGIGPKTRDLLADELGVEAAIEAIESADVRTLTGAGLPRGRATRILRHAHGGEAMDLLATGDARQVYKQLLELLGDYAVSADAADRIRILTPLSSEAAMIERLDDVMEARESWAALTDEEQTAVLTAFEQYDDAGGGDRAAVNAALRLRENGFDSGVFSPLADLDPDDLEDAMAALSGLEGDGDRVGAGAEDRLDSLREQLGSVEDAAATPENLLEEVQQGARGTDELQEELARVVTRETGVDVAQVREAMPADATDARDFVAGTMRTLASDLRGEVDEREAEVAAELSAALDRTQAEIDAAVTAVDEIAVSISLARFALAFDLVRPTFVEKDVCGVVEARNLFLDAADGAVQPITYAIGDHRLPVSSPNEPPTGDRVAVLTGANSGGKTTLLETLCQVQLLAQMGLPVPARHAHVGPVETIVFHRRHASFNAGVLESTLRSVVPPVSAGGKTLMLVDEFEAITEPGSAADLLHGLVQLTVEREALGVFVTHLADDLEPLPAAARTDGIFAEGLTTELELEVDYQPRFETVGRSTPEFIVSRLVADAADRSARAGYETLATAVGETAVQRTLADARWQE
ncbi:DNA mismatch repair protein [Halobacteriales archaeon SW_10_66_29]|nr:MAG: DNA mismatch repair protein [Halobacteriales archaeon SW_10_66_29]